ncbi:MAG TPA: hypothetical protein VJ911_03515, partial [Cryomorphaceae bacterium]|nr:hypothetical protein [Cryomorphaceae bacterium]
SNQKIPQNPKHSNTQTSVTPLPLARPPAGQPDSLRLLIAPFVAQSCLLPIEPRQFSNPKAPQNPIGTNVLTTPLPE